jgi:hypothetical protein
MISPRTQSELAFEAWCLAQGVTYGRIREARTLGHKRPDYALRLRPHWCFVEIKELDETTDDAALNRDVQSGAGVFRWINPGGRLRQSIKDAADQLRKFSQRGFPTVVCFFDKTSGFHLERVQVRQAMFGRETLHFEVSGDPAHEPRFVGMRYGKKATLTRRSNTSISAIGVLRQPPGSALTVDLYHNPHARVPIPHRLAAPSCASSTADASTIPIAGNAPCWIWGGPLNGRSGSRTRRGNAIARSRRAYASSVSGRHRDCQQWWRHPSVSQPSVEEATFRIWL